MAKLKDSGFRKDFGSGATRDISEGKGRCDLLPLKVISELVYYYENERIDDSEAISILYCIENFMKTKDIQYLYEAISIFIDVAYNFNIYTAILEVSIHYEDGARKYSERNWEKGIPIHCFIDSGIRHYLKWTRLDNDEPHNRAFIWNMLGIIWTLENRPEFNDV